ncbi:hypothetical protein [Promicromonospora panici]|uniref:hypothetical protein n=1 Tax=Promicromonospora panici TaxID=2219658 RepID=UPI00101C5A5E|nr:hypothetical protein [Promicromonospora panici]
MTHVVVLSPQEAIALVRPRKTLPSFVSELTCNDGVMSVTGDLRRLTYAPLPVKIAAKAVPVMHGSARITSFWQNIAVLQVDADAAGLPATKLLPLASGTITKMARKSGLPDNAVQLRKDGTISLDVRALMRGRFAEVTDFRFEDGNVVVEGVPA